MSCSIVFFLTIIIFVYNNVQTFVVIEVFKKLILLFTRTLHRSNVTLVRFLILHKFSKQNPILVNFLFIKES